LTTVIRASGNSKEKSQGAAFQPHSANAPPGTLKIYEIYEDDVGDEIEVHYFRHLDGTVSDVKVMPRS
jgi:hypothetical protein